MKYLKTFEESDPIIYNIFKFIDFEDDDDRTAEEGDLYYIIRNDPELSWMTIYNMRTQKVQDLWKDRPKDKIKMATHSEIEDFKFKYDMKKYNL